MKNIVFSHYGTTLDFCGGIDNDERWSRWRPNVCLLQQSAFHVDRLHLLHQKSFAPGLETILSDMRQISPDTEVVLEPYECQDPWDFEENYMRLYDFSQQYSQTRKFNSKLENYYVHLTTGTHFVQICLYLLTESHHFPSKFIESYPDEGYTAPGRVKIIDLDLSKYDMIASRFRQKTLDDLSYLKSGIATRNAAFNMQIERIEKVALSSSAPILITGPTGAGKSHLAHKIFQLRQERQKLPGKFVEVNCATLRSDSAMSALFGHVPGAFTGATAKREGLLREAQEGILFLDEIGELGLDEQAMLLHAIEYKTFMPLGADSPVSSNFQLICGTNRDLRQRVLDGEFREDLLARINLWTFRLPGLVDRREDIEPNLDYELTQYTQSMNSPLSFNANARKRFLEFAVSPEALWRGNFRDLNAAIVRMGTLSDGGRINLENVEEEISRLKESWIPEITPRQKQVDCYIERLIGERDIDLFNRVQLETVIRVCLQSKSVSDAGRKLFSASLSEKTSKNDSDRLRKYLKRVGLSWDDIKADADVFVPGD